MCVCVCVCVRGCVWGGGYSLYFVVAKLERAGFACSLQHFGSNAIASGRCEPLIPEMGIIENCRLMMEWIVGVINVNVFSLKIGSCFVLSI